MYCSIEGAVGNMGRMEIIKIVISLLFFISSSYAAPHRVELPAYVMKFVALFPNAAGPLAYCDYNTSPKSRNACDFRVHFDVLFPDDGQMIPYADLTFTLPNNRDYYVAEPVATYWRSPLPKPSYPGISKSLTLSEYAHILRDDDDGRPILFRITVFDRDGVGTDDVIAQESFSYTLNDVLKLRESIQTKFVKCRSEAKCHAIMIKFMFYLLEKHEEKRRW